MIKLKSEETEMSFTFGKTTKLKYMETSKQLETIIDKTKTEIDPIKKENLFKQVMISAWEQTDLFLKLNPDVRMHPREHIYREICGFPKEKK